MEENETRKKEKWLRKSYANRSLFYLILFVATTILTLIGAWRILGFLSFLLPLILICYFFLQIVTPVLSILFGIISLFTEKETSNTWKAMIGIILPILTISFIILMFSLGIFVIRFM